MGVSSVDHHYGVTALDSSASCGPACGPVGLFFPIVGILLRLPRFRGTLSWHGLLPQIRRGAVVKRGTRFSVPYDLNLLGTLTPLLFSHEAGVIISWFTSGSPYLHESFLFFLVSEPRPRPA